MPTEVRARAAALIATERLRFADRHPLSRQMAANAGEHFPGGVPLHWMLDWETPFPLFVREANGSTVTDIDGRRYADFVSATPARCSVIRRHPSPARSPNRRNAD